MAGSDPLDPAVIDWFFRGLAAFCSLAAVAIGYVLRLNASRMKAVEVRQDNVEALSQQNRLDIKEAEISVGKLQIHITENFCNKADIQQSLARVHEKIEDGNCKTDALNDNVSNKIDQLRRDLQADIRSAITIAVQQPSPK